MQNIHEILEYNAEFVKSRAYEPFVTDRYPDKKMVIVTCMDTRLIELLPKSMNLRNGDVKIIKNAGAIVSHPFGSVMRSILVAIYALKADEVLVIGHHDCGMTGMKPDALLAGAKEAGIPESTFETLQAAGIDLKQWLTGFDSVADGVRGSIELIRKHPLLPKKLPVHGLIIDPKTGKLDLLSDGTQFVK